MGEAALRCRFFLHSCLPLARRLAADTLPGRSRPQAYGWSALLPPSVRPGLVAPALVLRTPIRRARDHHHASHQAAYLRAESPPGTG